MKYLVVLLSFLLVTTSTNAETLRFTPASVYRLPGVLSRLEPGDRVILERGTYTFKEGLRLENLSHVTVEGRGRVEVIVSDLNQAVITLENCSDIQIKGLRARHLQPARDYHCEGAVVEVRRCNRVFVAHNRLNGCGAAGVYAVNSKDVVVFRNRIFNNTYAAIWVTDSQVSVHDNKIYDNAAALSTYGECDVSFTKNTIEDNEGNVYTRSTYFEEMTKER